LYKIWIEWQINKSNLKKQPKRKAVFVPIAIGMIFKLKKD